MYSEKMEQLIKATLADGVLTEKEKLVLFKRAQEEGIDLDELEVVLDARLVEMKKDEMEKAATSVPKSTKYGDLRKCPACGEIINNGIAVCGYCGYAFTESNSNEYKEKLCNALIDIDEKHKMTDLSGKSEIFKMKEKATLKGTLIANFHVPNTRADLLDFLTYLIVLAKPSSPKNYSHSIGYDVEDLGYAYWQLYSSCINKAKISFAKDPSFTYFYEKDEEMLADSQKFRLSRGTKFVIIYLAVMLAIIGLLAIMVS